MAARAHAAGGYADGAKYHQKQGNSHNCGATAFIVALNIVLGRVVTSDNVTVWRDMGSDTRSNLQVKGATWLKYAKLTGYAKCYKRTPAVKSTATLRRELAKGRCVILCANDAATWYNADGSKQAAGSHRNGHWIVFYNYADGKYYANDSSRCGALGAGAVYTESQMAAWLKKRKYTTSVIVAPK